MKISLNWLKEYVDIKIPDDELVRLIGSRLVEVEGVIDETHKYDNIYIVRVEKAEKIPDTHLTLCQIDVGDATSAAGSAERELVQVVCGAPNVREGMLAVWLKPGAVVPASAHETAPFVIGKRKMLGKYESCGMLAGVDELDFDDKHEKIAEIDPEMAKPGDLLADVFKLNDLILEIENKSLTHRPDTFGIIGFAREVAGILGVNFEAGVLADMSFSGQARPSSTSYAGRVLALESRSGSRRSRPSPRGERVPSRAAALRNPLRRDSNATLAVKIVDADICQRYTALILEKHGELEKKYLTLEDTLLAKSGMKPVSPVVDATNYLMLLTGQPLHAFDYDKFLAVGGSETAKVGVRLAKKGEKLELLDGSVIECEPSDILITSNDKPVALAGAMGGKNTEIDENTKNILLESATFNLYNLRKTQMAHGIFSEAITRFTKGQPAYRTLDAAEACAEMLSGGFKVAAITDEYPHPEKPSVVKITTTEINGLLGTNYSAELICKTLENVGFRMVFVEDLPEVTTEDEGASPVTDRPLGRGRPEGSTGASDPCPKQITIESPAWRTDIYIKEDIIEEVGRLLGYDNILPTLPLHATAEKNWDFERKRKVRGLMAKLGANEVLTYGFVSENLLKKANLNISNSYKIVNSISPELQIVRQSIVPSLLDKAYMNEKLPIDRFAIFEINQVYQKELGMDCGNVPVVRENLGFVVAERKNNETAFYKAKKYLNAILDGFGVEVLYVPLKDKSAISAPFEPKRSAEVRLLNAPEVLVGVVGEFKNSVRSNFKLAKYLAGFEINVDFLVNNLQDKVNVSLVNRKFEDVTIETTKTYDEVLREVKERFPNAKITPGLIYRPEGSNKKHMTFHILHL